MSKPELIINADDFGLRKSINDSIVMLMEAGVISSTTILVKRDGSAFRDAVSNALRLQEIYCEKLSFGLHLDLDNFFHFDETGHYGNNEKDIIDNYREIFMENKQEIIREIRSQIELLKNSGLSVSHIDGHHAIHCFPEILKELAPILKEHRIGVVRFNRNFYFSESSLEQAVEILNSYSISKSDYFCDLSDLMYSRIESSQFEIGTIIEAMAHTEIDIPRAEEWRLAQHKFLLENKEHLSRYNIISFNQLSN